MAQHTENRIALSEGESVWFREKMAHPGIAAAQRRDRTLAWIADHMEIQLTTTGFIMIAVKPLPLGMGSVKMSLLTPRPKMNPV